MKRQLNAHPRSTGDGHEHPASKDNEDDWAAIWTRKSLSTNDDLIELSGFEHTCIDPVRVAREIEGALGLTRVSKVLDVGCGGGLIAQHITGEVVGVDYRPGFVERFKRLGREAHVCEANSLCFTNHVFDAAYVHSVFQYFPNHEYAKEVVAELLRVARRAVLVCDVPVRSHSAQHCLYEPSFFSGWEISAGYYSPNRFNALWRIR